MDKIVIKGGNPLKGTVSVSGAKNAALPALASCLLAEGRHQLSSIPRLRDIDTIRRIMSQLGVGFHDRGEVLEVDSTRITNHEAPYELVKTMRASILLLGPLLARYGKAKISLPGGCAIGARPVNLHLKALAAMGVDMHLDQGYINARAPRLKGADIFFDTPTVTGTENIMMAAATASGVTVLKNAAREPEIQDLARLLRRMGADIEGDGTDTVVIRGVPELGTARHEIIPDRIEAGTFLIAAAMTGGEVRIEGCLPDHLEAVIEKVESAGAGVKVLDRALEVRGPDVLQSVDIKTLPYPGFPTDLQAQFMAMMAVADGWSMIRETIFENRFIHISELKRMGADIEINGSQALVRGKRPLLAAPVMATDLRASACLVLAGLVAEGGATEIHRIYHLDRGYERLEEKFSLLGADIRRVNA
ncbi:MAG: UDP-N-acetylglucosamine 1-carboxyvinyltransferase [Deltaproteobacteria bacterium]|nr:UDP-N-acetylglucosamine 1-carboxyvinyltransferase [Deltaproteobacteria bacterium]MBW1922822.1 UDP-N-acetylglucosamine 1-carboxyvinyltransferase [Deltaproteobacteria bacterium]MBW1948213.1 UDP-N-acetylglucosamine 1-carboxyvinyltransferase [Deltaproteobacteria bacterium]MBW2006559.1 UDP-N-acetylglucosamine 1-carboxyvinyltransferase [Deltaproteobacteria bacterium]MBW2346374.1 UDP-N-acetylglucosamine 1-carboxyvinyltransferase [Deltaproteobacteria bacterium]